MIQAQPFLKWAGGKRQLINEIEKNLPKDISKTSEIELYIEPFVGGGALLFHLLSNYSVKKSIINDINPDLILAYKVIKLYPEELIKTLRKIEKEFLKLSEEERQDFFYNKLRLPFNKLIVDYTIADEKSWTKKIALLIALNKTCFNGLFRQNSQGEFNVPFGRHKNPKLLNEENIMNCSILLKNTEILCGGYEDIHISKKTKALIYFDPPYRPLNKTSGFTKYSKEDFNDEDQKKLASYFKNISKQGHNLLLSNSDPKNYNSNDNFFEELYKDFSIQRVNAKRFINSNAKKRGNVTELLIKNY
jgi:DNA adenine methylase